MIRTVINTPQDVLEAVADQLKQNKTRPFMVQNFRQEIAPVETWILGVLSEEPEKPRYPIQWKSLKQKRAFFATNGFGHGIPYKRTHALSRAWKTTFKLASNRATEWGLVNDNPAAVFVQGKDAQPFHIDRWAQVKAYEIELTNRVTNATINAWFNTCEAIAFTKG